MAIPQTAYNNYDPRPMPVGTDLLPTAVLARQFVSGIPDNLHGKKLKSYDAPFLGGVNLPNPTQQVLPCLVSPSLNLNRVYGEPPIAGTHGLTPLVGNARNQPRGLATDPERDALFRKKLLPPPMNNNMKNFGA